MIALYNDSVIFLVEQAIKRNRRGYEMQETEVLVKTDTVRVRVMALTPREVAAWHFHTQVNDDIFCLTGKIVVRMQKPDEEILLSPGQRVRIETGRVHQLENLEETEAAYLLVQGIGLYDFNVINPKE
jgi:quercetin dioxygenase-like cupin family protein